MDRVGEWVEFVAIVKPDGRLLALWLMHFAPAPGEKRHDESA